VGSDSLYVMKPGNATYEPLSCEYFEIIQRGEAGF